MISNIAHVIIIGSVRQNVSVRSSEWHDINTFDIQSSVCV